MNDLQKYGLIGVGALVILVLGIVFINKWEDSIRSDERSKLLALPAKVDTVIKHDTIPLKGEAKGKKLYSGSWKSPRDYFFDTLSIPPTETPPDPCEDLKIPYVVEVNDKNVKGEIVCKPDSQSASWDLKVVRNDTATHSSKYISEEYSFWATPLAGYNKDGVLVGGMIGFKSIGIGVLQQEKPTWLVGLHFDF